MMRKKLQAINLTWKEASHLAKDREKWRIGLHGFDLQRILVVGSHGGITLASLRNANPRKRCVASPLYRLYI